MMVEIAVSTTTQITALTVFVTIKKTVWVDSLHLLLEMVSVMMGPTMKTAIMMEETAVDMTSILIIALIVHAITRRLVLLVLIP